MLSGISVRTSLHFGLYLRSPTLLTFVGSGRGLRLYLATDVFLVFFWSSRGVNRCLTSISNVGRSSPNLLLRSTLSAAADSSSLVVASSSDPHSELFGASFHASLCGSSRNSLLCQQTRQLWSVL